MAANRSSSHRLTFSPGVNHRTIPSGRGGVSGIGGRLSHDTAPGPRDVRNVGHPRLAGDLDGIVRLRITLRRRRTEAGAHAQEPLPDGATGARAWSRAMSCVASM